MRHYRLLAGLLATIAIGFFSTAHPNEVSADEAKSLTGGCPYFAVAVCNGKPTKGCPSSVFLAPTEEETLFQCKGNKKHTCGCVKKPATNCGNTTGYSNLVPCGSSTTGGSGGTMGSTGMD